jgi:hypothetical protein
VEALAIGLVTPPVAFQLARRRRRCLPANQLMLVRVPIYGLCDSGRGFWTRLDGEAKTTGTIF